MKKTAIFLVTLLILGTTAVRAAETPEQLVHQTTNEILVTIKAHREIYAKDHAKLYQLAEEKVLPYFDFVRMSQWVLGRNWRTATPAQRTRFVTLFRDLLVRTYSTALLQYTDQRIHYLPVNASPDATQMLVRTEVQQSGGAPDIPIVYSFYKNRSGEWKVYDVSIDGVSLVTNYRAVYSEKIRREGMDALLDSLAARDAQLKKKK
ncbi:MAG: MlaC/ttg2D family ABC transporter substrate-binding protein [Acidiferrobacterales bacterium]